MPKLLRRKRLLLMIMALILSIVMTSSPDVSFAERYEVFGDKTLYTVGYLRQKVQVGFNDPQFSQFYQLDGTDEGGVISSVTTFYSESQLELTKNTELAFTFRWQGDTADAFQSGNDWDNGSDLAWGMFKEEDDIDYDDHLDDMIRQFSFAYFGKNFGFRIGKQQLGWGQADGLRFMNTFMGLDIRKDYILLDSDEGYSESNIPLWMIKTNFTPGFNFGSSLGFQNLDLELSWVPDESNNRNRFSVGPRNGGPWALPLPELPLPLSQLNLIDDQDDFDFDDGAYGARLKGMWKGVFFTVNGYYGWSKMPTWGSSGLPTGNVGFVAPGFRGNVADAAPVDISGALPPILSVLSGGQPFGGLSLTLKKDYGRSKFIGFTCSKEIPIKGIARALGQYTYPVIRVEAIYDMDVGFNIGVPNPATEIFSDWIWFNNIEERDIYRYLIGVDWNLHMGWINPNDDVWMSFQFAQNIIDGSLWSNIPTGDFTFGGLGFGYPGGERQKLIYAPYGWHPERTETFTSLLLASSYWNDNLHLKVLYVHDWTYDSFWIKPKAKFEFGNHWLFEIGAYIIQGDREQQFGAFENLDSAYTMLTYQW